MANKREGLHSTLNDVLKTASEELLTRQDGYCFTVDNEPEIDKTELFGAYDSGEVSEFVNFDVIGDEDDDSLEAFKHLITGANYEDLTGDRKVLKILLESG